VKQTDTNDKSVLIHNALDPQRIRILAATTKNEALEEMVGHLAGSPAIEDAESLAQAVFKREELMSTGIGLGMAVPHVRLPSVREIVMAIGISPNGIQNYASLDDKPVRMIFMIAAPEGQHVEHLRLLSAISSRAKALNGHLVECTDPAAFYELITGDNDTVLSGND
jgi:PTS system nitrogen regulatory IIA component